VLPADVLQHVSITAPDGKTRKVVLHGEPKGRIVRVRCQTESHDSFADGVDLAVAVSPGLAGTSGPLGLEKAASFHVQVAGRLTVTKAGAHTPPDGAPHIGLQFNGLPDPEIVKQVLSIEPPVPFTLTRPNDSTLWVLAKFAPGTRYSLKIADSPAGGSAAAFP